jgi:hypothetical protein
MAASYSKVTNGPDAPAYRCGFLPRGQHDAHKIEVHEDDMQVFGISVTMTAARQYGKTRSLMSQRADSLDSDQSTHGECKVEV